MKNDKLEGFDLGVTTARRIPDPAAPVTPVLPRRHSDWPALEAALKRIDEETPKTIARVYASAKAEGFR